MTDQNFCDMTNDDAAKILDRIISDANWGGRYKYDFKVTMRCFFKWLKENRSGEVEIAFIRASHNANQILPEEILTEEEVRSIAQAADNLRDRALILVLYESGCRIGEVLGLRMKHVQPNEHGMALTVNGKTGSRRVLIISPAHRSKLRGEYYFRGRCRGQRISYHRINPFLNLTSCCVGLTRSI